MKRSMGTLALTLALTLAGAQASAPPYFGAAAGFGPGFGHFLRPGIVVLAEQRFDPAVQRWLAQGALRALPLDGGRLYYIVPADRDPRLEEMQIRYLEELLFRRAAEEAAAGEPPAATP